MIKHSLRKYAVRLLEDRLPYTAYEITEKEYIGRFEGSRSQLVDQLKERGYSDGTKNNKPGILQIPESVHK